MKIFSADQIKKWDAFSIIEQGLTSLDLMERAARACYHWLLNNDLTNRHIHIFCGKGNNGGDGLALARILLENNIPVIVYILEPGSPGSADFQANLQRLHRVTTEIHFLQSESFFPPLGNNALVIDALFGTGLNKPLSGMALQLVRYLNGSGAGIIAIDIPSGLFPDKSTGDQVTIHATHTLSFQNHKLAFLLPGNAPAVGELSILDIGLSSHFTEMEITPYEVLDENIIKGILKPRNKFSHKGNFGHAALVAGSYGMMGAALLAAKACLASGAGRLTCYIPSCGYGIMQASLPEAMCIVSGEKHIGQAENIQVFDAAGIGPGIGTQKEISLLLGDIFSANHKPLVLDADALNVISIQKELLPNIPGGSVITPHPREFERLFGHTADDFERLELAKEKAAALNIYIVLKGHYTAIITPRGKTWFNNTGNAGMAKAGMGDVLTGIITGLMVRGYMLPEAAILGVWLHGLGGDIAAERFSQEAMQASDLVDCLPDAWKHLYG